MTRLSRSWEEGGDDATRLAWLAGWASEGSWLTISQERVRARRLEEASEPTRSEEAEVEEIRQRGQQKKWLQQLLEEERTLKQRRPLQHCWPPVQPLLLLVSLS